MVLLYSFLYLIVITLKSSPMSVESYIIESAYRTPLKYESPGFFSRARYVFLTLELNLGLNWNNNTPGRRFDGDNNDETKDYGVLFHYAHNIS